ncbi:hypothetical protein BS47DRAFT_789231 [Hydnum rufescens UP504]|uniref:Alginate lyase domain-containing protein n=1 Tax=Hydnum rufescens UP504 TaxID=1448309 RepID=A0A9P6AD82_9AGAM|nr:hypothetical protein BS47DRAFT_789231 [Hydnum rufescens UP504]
MHAIFVLLAVSTTVCAIFPNYANEFIDPRFLVNSSSWSDQTPLSRANIVKGAAFVATLGPWSVMNKTILAPSNDPKDYLSWAPYAWPDCSEAGNTTELTPEQIWVQCRYVTRDGQFNPDHHLVNDTGAFYAMSDAVFYNAIAWRLTGSNNFSTAAVNFINMWFIDPATSMNPNMNYAQLLRGPGKQMGQYIGILDLRAMAKIATAVLTLRMGGSSEWTPDIDQGLTKWVNAYIPWMTNSSLAHHERNAPNNHGSFFYSQLASLYLIVNDTLSARKAIEEYFSVLYMDQIEADGEQPMEASRALPYHYRIFNLIAMITNAKIGQYVGFDAWNLTTNKGGSIQKAADYVMSLNASSTGEAKEVEQLFQVVGAVSAVYGDPDGKYREFLQQCGPG